MTAHTKDNTNNKDDDTTVPMMNEDELKTKAKPTSRVMPQRLRPDRAETPNCDTKTKTLTAPSTTKDNLLLTKELTELPRELDKTSQVQCRAQEPRLRLDQDQVNQAK